MNLKDMPGLDWEQILRNTGREGAPPVTANLPLHPAHSPDFVFTSAALNAYRLRVLPGMGKRDRAEKDRMENVEVMMIQFALDNPPFVPEFGRTRTTLDGGRHPLAASDYFALDIHYRFEYFCSPLDERQNILWVACSVTNEDTEPRETCVRARVLFLPEKTLFFNHYAPFALDASNYHPGGRTALDGQVLLLDRRPVGRVSAESMDCAWEARADYRDEDYNKRFDAGTPYFVRAEMRYRNPRNSLRFSALLQPNETAAFTLALFVDYENATEKHLPALLDPARGRERARRHFRSLYRPGTTRFEGGTERWGDIFTELQTGIFQLLVDFPGRAGLMTAQGGGTQGRHLVWVMEALHMLLPMMRLGHFETMRRALDFIFSFQDSPFPPEGKLAGTEGAVGSTGPRWLSTTGAALGLACDFYRLSGDRVFLDAYLAKMLRAGDWVLREIRATRKADETGRRALSWGLMPFGQASDGDRGIFLLSDAYSWWGLNKLALLLEEIAHPRAEEVKRERNTYRDDITAAVTGLTRPDGRIERRIAADDEYAYGKFEHICGAEQLFFTGAVAMDFPGLPAFIRYREEKISRDCFTGPLDRDVVYIGFSEHPWQEIYLRRGEWKKAFALLRTNMLHGMTPETFQTQERFSTRCAGFTPWQPNGSGNGRMLTMMLNALYFPCDVDAVLLGCFPWAWLKDNRRTVLRDLHVPGGRVTLEALMDGRDRCRVTLSADCPAAMPRNVRFPEHLEVVCLSRGAARDGKNRFTGAGKKKLSFRVRSGRGS